MVCVDVGEDFIGYLTPQQQLSDLMKKLGDTVRYTTTHD